MPSHPMLSCRKCRAARPNLHQTIEYDQSGNAYKTVHCRLCGYATYDNAAEPMRRRVNKGESAAINMVTECCTVIGCSTLFATNNSKYKMCSRHSLVHRRWIERVNNGAMTVAAPFIFQDGTWLEVERG